MNDDRVNEKVSELLTAARPEVPDGWEARLEIRLNEPVLVKPYVSRFVWAIRLAGAAMVLLALGLLPISVQQTKALHQASAVQPVVSIADAAGEGEDIAPLSASTTMDETEYYRRHAVEYVQSHYPHDPEMLLAAGVLAADKQAGLKLLASAAQVSRQPAVWAAYLDRLILLGPVYRRPGNLTKHPKPPGVQEQVTKMTIRGLPHDRLTEAEARPLLDALRAWQRIEPKNAYPLVLEMKYLYGLHQDDQALLRWEAAARLPFASSHTREITHAVVRLLDRMGLHRLPTFYNALGPARPHGFLHVQECARIAQYEARKAQEQDRPRNAMRWWKATADLGNLIQNSQDTDLDFLIGYLVERVGVAPSWEKKYIAGKSHFYYGPQHALFVDELGEAGDAALRDRFLVADARVRYLTEHQNVFPDAFFPLEVLLNSSQYITWVALFFAIVWFIVAASARSRKERTAPVPFTVGRRLLLAVIIGLPCFLGSGMILFFPRTSPQPFLGEYLLFGGCVLSCVFALLLPLLTIWRHRTVTRGAAWRGTVRQVLPMAAVFCALLTLSLFVVGRWVERRAVNELVTSGDNSLSQAVRTTDPAWIHPSIPADAWVAAYPPEKL